MLGSASHPKARVFKIVERTSDVGDLCNRQVHHSTRRRLIATHGDTRGTLVGNNHASSAHNLGRSNDGAKVAIIGHVVKHEYEGWALTRTSDDVRDAGIRERTYLKCDALMSPMAGNGIELRSRHRLDGNVRTIEVVNQTSERRIGALAVGNESALDRKARAQRLGGSTTSLDKVARRYSRALTRYTAAMGRFTPLSRATRGCLARSLRTAATRGVLLLVVSTCALVRHDISPRLKKVQQ